MLLLPNAIEPPAIVQYAQTITTQSVETTGQVRNSFTVHFQDGTSLSFTRGEHIYVVNKVFTDGRHTGWTCQAHNKTFTTGLANVQI